MEAEAYYSLISVLGQTDTDHRRGSIEIQLNCNLILKRLQVLAVAMPENFGMTKNYAGLSKITWAQSPCCMNGIMPNRPITWS